MKSLLALATNPGTTEDERRSAAVKLARLMKEEDFFGEVEKLGQQYVVMADLVKKMVQL